MKVYDAKTSFAGGELSPNLYGRIDLAQYQIGARTLQNFIVLPQGGIVNRPGTIKCGPYGYGSLKLVPFIFSEDDCCVLAFTDVGVVEIYNAFGYQGRITGSPYTREHFKKLRWLQSGDVLYLFHPKVPVQMLSRTAYGWQFEKVDFKKGPFEDVNTDPDKKLSFLLLDKSTALFQITSNFNMSSFLCTDLLFYAEADIKSWSDELTVGQDGWVTVKNVFGPFTFKTSGKWTGTLEVERCRPDDWIGKDESNWSWEGFKTYTSEKNAEENFSYSGTVEEYANHYRFKFSEKKPITVTFSYEGGVINRVFQVDSLINNNRAVKAFDADHNNTKMPDTDAWAVGSFNAKYGYPSVGVFHQERLVLANTPHSPQTIWMSQPASWHNFGTSIPTKDEDSIAVTLASKEINEIRGLASREDLLIFTAGGEWVAKAGSKSDVFTPSSIVVTPTGYRGSADIQPLEVGDITLFMQRHAMTVRSIGYTLEVDGYSSRDISILSEHMFNNNPVVAWGYQQTPWSVIWCALSDGTCAALTLQQEHQVTAWTRQVFSGGNITDVCCIPGRRQDDVYFAVLRNGYYYIERLRHRDNYNDTFKDIETYPVHSIFESLDWEIRDGSGTIQGRFKHIPAITLRLLNTFTLKGCVITENSASPPLMDELQFPGASSPGPSQYVYSGDVRLLPPGKTARTCRVRLENDTGQAVTILGLFPELVISSEEVSASGSSE